MNKEEKSKSSKYLDEEEFKKELEQQTESVLRIFESYNEKKEQSMIYSEVYGILNMLGKDYIDLIPKEVYNTIKENKNPNYTPVYDINKPLSKQNIRKRTASFMAMLHYDYWCKSDKEKAELNEMLEKNHKS